MNQKQIYSKERVKLAEADKLFLEMVAGGMTREELAVNIKRRPSLWGRYSHWLDKLPRAGA